MANIVFEPNVCNNTSIDMSEYNKIAPGKTAYADRDGFMTANYTNQNVMRFSTLLADNTHDGLSPLCVTSNTVENNMLKETKVLNDAGNPNITTELSNVGTCIEFENPGVNVPQNFTETVLNLKTVPYDIPNNMKNCFIRDCFDGSWVPGLNNIFDQAGSSLKSFIDYHNKRNTITLINPIKIVKDGTVAGGIGQQLATQKNSEFLKFTAYFNYDLLWFVYITNVYKTGDIKDNMDTLITKVKTSINTPNASALLTPNDIFVINTVNINFLWCHLMIYCHKCVDSDEFFKNNDTYRTGYISALNHLTQIRFDSFATTADGYISNPYIYYRKNNATIILKGTYADWLPYIKGMCTQIYINNPDYKNGFGTTNINTSTLAGGVEYVTSQTMAATCMSTFLNLIFPGRSKKTGDATKIAAMNEINKLFSLMGAKDYKGYGWAALKFSGDSAHIVFGVIMEAIKKAYTAAAAFGEALNYEIIYAISERPLAARLIAAQKNVYSSFNNVFIENFKGNGSENKAARHAALYIQWDPTSTFISMVKGLADKMKAKPDLLITTQIDIVNVDDFATITNDTVIQKFNDIRKIFVPAAPEAPEAPLTPETANELITSYNTFIKEDNVKTFLNAYNIKILKDKLEEKRGQIFGGDGKDLSILLTYFGGNRGKGHTNWLSVMVAYNKDKKDDKEKNIILQFDLMYETINLLVEYYVTANIDPEVADYAEFIQLFPGAAADGNNFKKIFKQIINAHRCTIWPCNGEKNEVKIAAFRETREENWRSKSEGKGDTIPGKVGSIISRMETLLTNCFKIYDKSPVNTMKGGGNIQFGGALSADDKVEIKQNITESGDLLMDALTNAKLNETYVGNDFSDAADDADDDADDAAVAIEKSEREYIRSSIHALEEDYKQGPIDIGNPGRPNQYYMEKILANRLKLIEMDNKISTVDFTDKYNEEKGYLNRAIAFVKDKVFTGKNIASDVIEAMNVDKTVKDFFIISKVRDMLDEIFTHGAFNDDKVIENFNDISDIKKDTDVKFIARNNVFLKRYYNNTPAVKANINTKIKTLFSNIIDEKCEDFLQFIQIISTSNDAALTAADKNLYNIARNRSDIATKISSYGLMEPVFDNKNEAEDLDNDTTRTARIGSRARVNQFLASLGVKVYQAGGRKTRKRRRIRTNRTKKKRYATKTSHRKKTKNANRSKKNKTRRKRHY